MKLGGKRAELVQKFVPRSCVRIFHNECTRSTPLDPKLMFWCVFVLFGCIEDRLVALRNLVQNRPNKCKSLCHKVVSEFFATNAPDPPHWTLNWCFCAFCTIWVHLGPFVLPDKTRCKMGRTSAKVRYTKSRRNFSQRTHPILLIGH